MKEINCCCRMTRSPEISESSADPLLASESSAGPLLISESSAGLQRSATGSSGPLLASDRLIRSSIGQRQAQRELIMSSIGQRQLSESSSGPLLVTDKTKVIKLGYIKDNHRPVPKLVVSAVMFFLIFVEAKLFRNHIESRVFFDVEDFE